jgi:hypothetical protein
VNEKPCRIGDDRHDGETHHEHAHEPGECAHARTVKAHCAAAQTPYP